MGRYSRSVFFALTIASFVVAVQAGLATPAAAQDDAALSAARERFRQGEAYFKAELYDKAVAEYRAAYELAPRPGLLFNIGLCYEKLGNPARAVDYYGRFLSAEPAGPKAPEARARREALLERIVAQQSEAERQTAARQARDAGKTALETGAYDTALEKFAEANEALDDPELLFFVAEAYRGKGDRILAATEYRRYLETAPNGANRERASARLRELDREKAAEQPNLAAAAAPAEPPLTRGSFLPAVVAGSVALAAGAVGLGLGLSSSGKLDDLDDRLTRGDPPLDTGDSIFEDGKGAASAARISFAIAGVAAVTTVVLAVLAARKRPAPSGTAIALPTVGNGVIGLGVGVTW